MYFYMQIPLGYSLSGEFSGLLSPYLFFKLTLTSHDCYYSSDRAAVCQSCPGFGMQPGADDPAGNQHVPGRQWWKVTAIKLI